MTLKELLETVSREQMVNIGSGSGFFFCGPLGDFFDRKEKIESGIVKKYQIQYERAAKELESLKRRDDGGKEFKAAIRKQNTRKKNAQAALDAFKPLDEREVIDTCRSLMDKRFVSIVIKGQEHGSYWDYAEYLEANGPKEKYEEEVKRVKEERRKIDERGKEACSGKARHMRCRKTG